MEQSHAVSSAHSDRRSTERLFHRDLPGGGYVAIELSAHESTTPRRVRVIVERRSDRARRLGHRAPVILDEPWNPDRGIGELYRFACDNVSIARGLLQLQRVD
jgi:hypothetical protein